MDAEADARWKVVLRANCLSDEALERAERCWPVEAPGEIKDLHCVEPNCSGILRLRWSHQIERFWYSCSEWPKCQGSLPADRDGSPRGEPRTRELQEWRVKAHEVFDVLWKDRHCNRSTAYAWFRRVMVLPPDEAHIFKQDIEGCRKLISLVQEKGPGTKFWKSWFRPGKRRKPKKIGK